MTTAKNAGRMVAVLLLAQMLVSPIVNFALLLPLFKPPGFLEQAAAHATTVSVAAMLGIGAGVLSCCAGTARRWRSGCSRSALLRSSRT